jgi:hypothetical protein
VGAVLVERLTKYLLMMECKRCGELVFPHESDAIDEAKFLVDNDCGDDVPYYASMVDKLCDYCRHVSDKDD